MASTTEETPILENGLSADAIKTYILRTDSIVPCSVADVRSIPQALKDIEAFWLGTVPCRTVRLVGILASAVEYESRSVYSVDDGTGVVNCIKKRPVRLETVDLAEGSVHVQSRGYDIGDTVSVVGNIQEIKGVRQILVSSIQRSLLPDAESRHILNVLEHHRTRYSQPFTIPPLPTPATPQKHPRSEFQPNYASSMASSPTATGFSSPVGSPKKARPRLRHPSRLRSKDLNENVFRIYLSHVLISTLSAPEASSSYFNPASSHTNNPTTLPSGAWSNPNQSDATPKRPSRPISWELGSPTPKKPTSRRQLSPVPPEDSPLLGVTLSYLRRVQVLAELARRIVNQVTHERDKVLRHAERSARAKYEVLHPPSNKHGGQSKSTNSLLDRPGAPIQSRTTSSGAQQLGPYKSTKALRSTLTSHNSGIRQLQPSPGSSRISVSTAKSPSRAKIQRTETLTTAEAARRATYHAKLSKLHAEDLVKRPARTKRLFESALRTLVKEGEVVLYEGPRRHVASSKSVGKRGFAASSELWPDVTNTTDGASSRHLSVASSKFTAHSSLDLETISEDDDEFAELSDPSDSEDAYVPVTPRVLRPALLTALRQTLMRHRGGVDFASWMRTLRADEQWSRVPDLVLKEAIDELREEEWIHRVGGERWDFTRGSWARSLTLS
ncbi:hypothetical protein RhiJN_19542 [Ceratobasidium sp. AG-Ba]|nr:hypothetical protein RhiJN_19542 [Ceratobasidium sp. AG-Ba]